MAFDYSKITRGPVISKFAHITRSELAQQLMEAEERGLDESVTIPFEGDADKSHRKTVSIRRTMARHCRRLFYKRGDGVLHLKAFKDSSINPVDYITKPRKKVS